MRNIIGEKASTKLVGRLRRTFDFVDLSDIQKKSILDIGCGYGWFEFHSFKKGARSIVGVEISEDDLSTIKKSFKKERFIPLVGTASSVKVKDESFDTVVAWEVIEHIPKGSEEDFFKEVKRILRPGGSFYLSTPFDAPGSTLLDPAFWLIGHRHYSYRKLVHLGLQNGFYVEKVIVVGGIWTSLSIINMYVSKWVFRRERFFSTFFNKKEDEEYRRDGFYNIFVKYKKNA